MERHHNLGARALVEMPVSPGSNETRYTPCTVIATASADDRPYRLIVRLEDGRAVGPCAPECVISVDYESLRAAIDAVCAPSKERFQAYLAANHGFPGGATCAFEFMTPEERAELHRLQLALPSTGQLAAEARERLTARRQARLAQLNQNQ